MPATTSIVVPMPAEVASGGTSSAVAPMPRGRPVWRMPIAVPRRWAGNQPTTSLPLAEFVDPANRPITKKHAPRAT